MKEQQNIKDLFQKYLDDDYSPEELDIILEYFSSSGNSNELSEFVQEALENEENGFEFHPEVISLLAESDGKMAGLITRKKIRPTRLIRWMAAAAALILIFGSGYLYFMYLTGSEASYRLADNHISPGTNSATLILSNGKRLKLSDLADGRLAEEEGVRISKSAKGELNYEVLDKEQATSATNTLNTANGETFVVALPDGTRVWLNAASSLTYPARFAGQGERKVTLTGEGYFEVAKDPSRPFAVETPGQQVKVLGTHFDINTYGEAAGTKTTLLEGSVRVTSKLTGASTAQSGVTLKPGEQSVLAKGNLSVKPVEPEDAVAWKNGYFMFNNANLETIMAQIARWYDVTVEFRDQDIKREIFFGTVSKYGNISQVLQALERTGVVRFKIENNHIIISKRD